MEHRTVAEASGSLTYHEAALLLSQRGRYGAGGRTAVWLRAGSEG